MMLSPIKELIWSALTWWMQIMIHGFGNNRNKWRSRVFGFSENRKRLCQDLEIPSFGGRTALGDAMSDS